MKQIENIAIQRERLKRYCEAESAILHGQSYNVEGLSLTRADLEKVQNMIAKLMRTIDTYEMKQGLMPKRSRMKYIVPRDVV